MVAARATAEGDEGETPAGGGPAVHDDPLAMTAADRAACRAWGTSVAQKVLNQYDITERPASRGSLSPKLVRAWHAEGRPVA